MEKKVLLVHAHSISGLENKLKESKLSLVPGSVQRFERKETIRETIGLYGKVLEPKDQYSYDNIVDHEWVCAAVSID